METAIASHRLFISWTICLMMSISIFQEVYTSSTSTSPARPAHIFKEFYRPMYSPNEKQCPKEGCNRCLVTCKYATEHENKNCEFCPGCDQKCKACAEGYETCSICLESHPVQDEVVLLCNDVFGRDCLNGWISSNHNTCPLCNATIKFKESAHCNFCDSEILPSERSCSYTCNFRVTYAITRRSVEKHVCHERCIIGFAEKNAFVLQAGGTSYFRCPLEHKESVETGSDLYVKVIPLVPSLAKKGVIFPVKGSEPHACEICHRTVTDSQKKSTYTCNWQRGWSLKWGKKDHLFHEECLKPIAERRGRKNSLGYPVFYCPGDHNDGFDTSIRHQHQLEIPLHQLHFVPHKDVKDLCPICDKEIDWKGPEAAEPLVHCDPPHNEMLFCHKKCLVKYILDYHRVWEHWISSPTITIPCPAHLLCPDRRHLITLTRAEHTEFLKW